MTGYTSKQANIIYTLSFTAKSLTKFLPIDMPHNAEMNKTGVVCPHGACLFYWLCKGL